MAIFEPKEGGQLIVDPDTFMSVEERPLDIPATLQLQPRLVSPAPIKVTPAMTQAFLELWAKVVQKQAEAAEAQSVFNHFINYASRELNVPVGWHLNRAATEFSPPDPNSTEANSRG